MQTLEEYLNEHLDPFSLDELITEKKKVVRIRDGKKETVYVATKPGYKMKGDTEVKMAGKEISARKRGQKIGQQKRNSKMKQIQKKIEKGKHTAEQFGLDIGRPEE